MNSEDDTRPNSVAEEPTRLTRSRRNDLFPLLTIIWIATSEIEDAPRRVRKEKKAQLAALKRSIERYGNRIPILVRQKNAHGRHEVLDGHARFAAARMLGAEEMPCLIVDDLPDAEIRRLALSLNRIQEAGEWDSDELRLELGELIAIDEDYEIPGFDIPEIEAALLK
ncbi:MAG TPA: ParB N-terminal domain-containing protein, partial [Tabrizicola sp.]|nr:ParB N-terminal domain-containing protein [Tabrizicola sp.]